MNSTFMIDDLDDQRKRVAQILADSGKVELFRQIADNRDLVLKPGLEISCDVGAQSDVLSILRAFEPSYMRLVLEAILDVQIDYIDDTHFLEQLNQLALKRIFHSPAIARNKRLVYTRGNWLTDEGKKAVERHFLFVICQIFYLMEECLQQRVILNNKRMFKRDASFEIMQDVFSFISRELISGKTLLPKVMESVGFKPSYAYVGSELENSSHYVSMLRSFSVSPSNKQRRTNVETSQTKKIVFGSSQAWLKTTKQPQDTVHKSLTKSQPELEVKINAELLPDFTNSFLHIEQSNVDFSALMNQTQMAAKNLSKHANNVNAYQSAIFALYERLKQTAKFLASIVHSLGLDDSQIELLMQKINQLQLELRETSETSERMLNETKQMVNDLTNISVQIEASIRQQSVIDPNNSNQSLPVNNEPFGALIAENAELVEKNVRLETKITELRHQLESMIKAREGLNQELHELKMTNQELSERYKDVQKLNNKRDEELQDRDKIIEKLGNKQPLDLLPADFEKNVENQMERIFTTLSDVTNKHS